MTLFRRISTMLAVAVGLVGFLATASAQQQTQARFAFVVGDDAYDGAPLATAANDAALVADALKTAGFDVMGARNLDQDSLRASYREFLAKVAAAGDGAVSFVYLSGYGVQADGDNYLIPPGASVQRDSDVALNAIRLSDLIRPLSGTPGRGRVVLLDLAYNGPFAKQGQPLAPGLAIVEPDPGTIVGFNAAPGVWAPPGKEPYGPYAQALSEMLREPGLPIEEILTRVRMRTAELTRSAQVPWTGGKIAPPVVLLERGPNAPPPKVSEQQLSLEREKPLSQMPENEAYSAAIDRNSVKGYEDFVATYPQSPYAKNARGLLAAEREARTWRRTLNVNTANAYWSYLGRYPKGPHAAEARRRLARLSAPVEPPPSYDPVVYDVPPPPPVELGYFDAPAPDFYDPGVPPIVESVFFAAPPPWYEPPPPPVYDDGSEFFLPVPTVVAAPDWVVVPPVVILPVAPVVFGDPAFGLLRNPYFAVPVAVAASIAAGRLMMRQWNGPRRPPGFGALGQKPKFMPHVSGATKAIPAGLPAAHGVGARGPASHALPNVNKGPGGIGGPANALTHQQNQQQRLDQRHQLQEQRTLQRQQAIQQRQQLQQQRVQQRQQAVQQRQQMQQQRVQQRQQLQQQRVQQRQQLQQQRAQQQMIRRQSMQTQRAQQRQMQLQQRSQQRQQLMQRRQAVQQRAIQQRQIMQQRRPVMQRPVMQRPVMQRPVMQRPVMQRPVMQRPVMQRPAVQRPVFQQPRRH